MAIKCMVMMDREEMRDFTIDAINEYWTRLLEEYEAYRVDHLGESTLGWAVWNMKRLSEEFDREYAEVPFIAHGAFLIGMRSMAENPSMPIVFAHAVRALSLPKEGGARA